MSDWWVRAHWGRAFEIVEVAPRVHNQSWALLRRRDVELTIADLERPEHRSMPSARGSVPRPPEASSAWRMCSPAAISTTMMAATTTSTAMQKGGHQRVLATNWVRCCQAGLG